MKRKRKRGDETHQALPYTKDLSLREVKDEDARVNLGGFERNVGRKEAF